MELKGLIAPQLVPFREDGSVAREEYARLTAFLTANGADGIFVCGTSGEFENLTVEERLGLLGAAMEGKREDTTILFNTTALNRRDMARMVEAAGKAGADAISFTAPFYHKYDKESLMSWFSECASMADGLPVYLYNMPGLTGNPITPEILSCVVDRHPCIKGIKDSSMDYMTYLEFRRVMKGRDFKVITGNDAQVLTTFLDGADTAVIAMASVFPALSKSIITNLGEGREDEAKRAQDTVMELRALARSVMPVMAHKEMLSLQGFRMGGARLPFRNLRSDEKKRIKDKLEELELI